MQAMVTKMALPDNDDLLSEARQALDRLAPFNRVAGPARPKASIDLLSWYKESTPHFTWTWPYQLRIIEELEKVTSGETDKLMVFMPPRYGKSALITERFPIYRLERNPSLKIGIGCHSQKLAQRFGRRARSLAVQRGIPLSRESRSVREWETTLDGVFRAFGVGSPPTGEGFQLLVLDDLIRDYQEAYSEIYRDRVWDWLVSDVYTRREPKCKMIMVMHRWRVDDIADRVLNSPDGKNWKIISFPALAEEDDILGREVGEPLCPARFGVSDILSAKRLMTSHDFSARYQQKVIPSEGANFNRQWFGLYRSDVDQFSFPDGSLWTKDDLLTIVFLDPSLGKKGGDASGLLAVGYCPDGKVMIFEAIAKRIPIEKLGAETARMMRVWGADYACIESAGGFHVSPMEYLQKENWTVREVVPGVIDKLARAQAAIIISQQGFVYVPDNKPDWLEMFFNQLVSFTGLGDEKDELVDVFAYAAKERGRFYSESVDAPLLLSGGMNRARTVDGRMLSASDVAALMPHRFVN